MEKNTKPKKKTEQTKCFSVFKITRSEKNQYCNLVYDFMRKKGQFFHEGKN